MASTASTTAMIKGCPWSQFAVFAVYTAVLLVVGGVLFRKREA